MAQRRGHRLKYRTYLKQGKRTDYMVLTIVRPSIFFLLGDILVGPVGSSCIGVYPRGISGCFPASVPKLYSNCSALGVCKVYNPLERFYVAVGPNPLDDNEDNQRPFGAVLTISSGDIRPSGTTAVASTMMAPTPREAKPWEDEDMDIKSFYQRKG